REGWFGADLFWFSSRSSLLRGLYLCTNVLWSDLVLPTGNISSVRSSLFDALEYLRQVHYVVPQSRKVIGQVMIAIPAVLGAIAVIYLACIERIGCALQKLLDKIDCIVQIIVIHVAAIDVYLAFELRAERLPIAFEDMTEVIIFAPVFGHRTIYLAGHLVPDALRITVGAYRRIDRLPDVPLIARPAFRA